MYIKKREVGDSDRKSKIKIYQANKMKLKEHNNNIHSKAATPPSSQRKNLKKYGSQLGRATGEPKPKTHHLKKLSYRGSKKNKNRN